MQGAAATLLFTQHFQTIGTLVSSSYRDGQTKVWAFFQFLLIKLKFQWVILYKLNISILVVNGPFFCSICQWPMVPHYPNHCSIYVFHNSLITALTAWYYYSQIVLGYFDLYLLLFMTIKYDMKIAQKIVNYLINGTTFTLKDQLIKTRFVIFEDNQFM